MLDLLGELRSIYGFLFDSLITSEKVWIKEWGALGYMPKFEIKRTLRVNVLFRSHMVKGGFFFCFTVQNLGHPYWLTLAPMYVWFIIFFIQPHKEERFLFPVYPLICLCGAVALSALQVSFREMCVCFILFHIKSFRKLKGRLQNAST